MRHKIASLLFYSTFFLLTHCATTSMAPPQNQAISWEKRQQTLSQLQQWDIQSTIGITTPQDSISASLIWAQRGQHYTLSLIPPFGSNTAILTGQPGRAELTLSNGKTFTASSPEILLAAQTAMQLPVSSLYYWIRGLPQPFLPANKQLDAYQHLLTLTQQGWNIHYLQYTSLNGIDLPLKIVLFNPAIRAKIIIRRWQI